MRRTPRTPRFLARTGAAVATALVTLLAGLAVASPARADNVVTPGNFTGYGFDQCVAPNQHNMDAWLSASPYLAAGIYISGDSRGCPRQPNLTPTWVRTQLAKGWRLLPITLGPQAWCTTRERYLHQVRISPSTTRSYAKARSQGNREADKTIAVARRLGIAQGSTLWYDLEAFNIRSTTCRDSALSFLAAWTRQLHASGYVSGVYSSAASGIKMMDDARVLRPGRFTMPDQVWIADWNGRANVSSSYVRSTGWMPHKRVHQYRGGHNERHGGVTINIDQNWLDLGKGSTIAREPSHCGGAASYNYGRYPSLATGDRGAMVKTVQCLLRSKGMYAGSVDGVYGAAVGAAVRRYRSAVKLAAGTSTTQSTWVALLSRGDTPVLKYGSASSAVRRLQRSLNAADAAGLSVTGVFTSSTATAVRAYQGAHGLSRTGVANASVWKRLVAGTP
jgi:glycoside hydrolase-like protein/putative peptidoglycan binding protein